MIDSKHARQRIIISFIAHLSSIANDADEKGQHNLKLALLHMCTCDTILITTTWPNPNPNPNHNLNLNINLKNNA